MKSEYGTFSSIVLRFRANLRLRFGFPLIKVNLRLRFGFPLIKVLKQSCAAAAMPAPILTFHSQELLWHSLHTVCPRPVPSS